MTMTNTVDTVPQPVGATAATRERWLDDILTLYPVLTAVRPSAASLLPAQGPLQVPAGTVLFNEGQPCPGFPLLLDGEVRISRRSADGRSMELYRVGPGELCLVSTACLFNAQPMSGEGTATRPTRVLLLPAAAFEQWLGCREFRAFVMGLFAQRLTDLASLVEAVAFQRLDQRLAAALLGHGPELTVTHQELAARLGTVREIVTRLLRRFEREGWIGLGRERIRILDCAALRTCAAGR
jgi:CRP/FNR family transcriptional regulator, anaerobic regulatory protein